MTRVLFVGQQPETVDFSDPALPPGLNAEKINAGIAIAAARIAERAGGYCWTRKIARSTPALMVGQSPLAS